MADEMDRLLTVERHLIQAREEAEQAADALTCVTAMEINLASMIDDARAAADVALYRVRADMKRLAR